MKIICEDCDKEFDITVAEKVEIIGANKFRYDCPCGCGAFILIHK